MMKRLMISFIWLISYVALGATLETFTVEPSYHSLYGGLMAMVLLGVLNERV